ncbi:uncharacterized protein C6orf47 homolog [Entelurus aequoreus]|uniref:uncharacterized protein C6orf47 homolog n=1 Tax=Entelurus aequoreus TaxID=161455 RepID=UPI002B1DA441|nr:uncharacterized protein C6orf47 homolog [Entelurus aequoreus]XP_061912748.1 uncharacterized protein C6orf47 homolog [Entelurus aequoreus]XP_061912749.1 uncharacterized protein C6orf47 homolog [Entelurus aequoreus]
MTAVVGRAWGWVRSWGSSSSAVSDKTTMKEVENNRASGTTECTVSLKTWTSWFWGGWNRQKEQISPVEDEYWEAPEKLQPVEIEELWAGKKEPTVQHVPKWWNKYLPTSYLPWTEKTLPSGLRKRKCHISKTDRDIDGDFSDYKTPPPSPTPLSRLTSPFRLFVHNQHVELYPEHYEICFNFLRHLFDLFVVGFLWIVSPPVKLILEIVGIQGPLKLWLHGMAMFFVSTVGMAGLLWLIQEHLPEFALIYGIVQALVISVSLKKSVLFGMEEEQTVVEVENRETELTDEDKKEKLI